MEEGGGEGLESGSGGPARLLFSFPELVACVLRGFKKLGRDELPSGLIQESQPHMDGKMLTPPIRLRCSYGCKTGIFLISKLIIFVFL